MPPELGRMQPQGRREPRTLSLGGRPGPEPRLGPLEALQYPCHICLGPFLRG